MGEKERDEEEARIRKVAAAGSDDEEKAQRRAYALQYGEARGGGTA